MNLQQLRYVKALVEKGTFVAAACSCAVTQPTLSNGIAQLENELGYQLFRRTTRSVGLTPYGEKLLPTVLEILSLFEKLRELSKAKMETPAATFQVGVSPLAGIRRANRILTHFRRSRPSTEVAFREARLEHLCEEFDKGNVDILVTHSDPDLVPMTQYESMLIDQDPLVFLPMHSEACKWSEFTSVSLNDIAQEVFVPVSTCYGISSIVTRMFADQRLELRRYPTEATNFETVKEFAEADIACGLLPQSRLGNYEGRTIPLVEHLVPLAIEHFIIAKPESASSELLTDLWGSLLKANGMIKKSALFVG